MSSFDGVETAWLMRLGKLRNVVRQHLVREQLHGHLSVDIQTVLDVGCGQGTQAVELAARGLAVTGVDPSREFLDLLADDANARGCVVEPLVGSLDDLDVVVNGRVFDLVCAHGLLMYLPDAQAGLAQLARRVRPGGLLSFTFRNRDALAYRPGVRGDWRAALAAFESDRYVNELGADARAHNLEEVCGWCADLGLEIEQWYGVRLFTDARAAEEDPDPATLPTCLAAEVEAGRRDPYRRLGSQLHVIARRSPERPPA